MFSQMAYIDKIREYYDRASSFATTQKERLRETSERLHDMEEAGEGLPGLI